MRPRRCATLSLPEDLAGIRVATVGEPTARALRDIGVNVELVASGTGAGALADQLIGAGAGGGAVWLPQGEAARIELGERLRQAGAEVVVTVCYRTVAIAGLRRLLIPAFAERLDAVTLLSPSAVDAVIGRHRPRRPPRPERGLRRQHDGGRVAAPWADGGGGDPRRRRGSGRGGGGRPPLVSNLGRPCPSLRSDPGACGAPRPCAGSPARHGSTSPAPTSSSATTRSRQRGGFVRSDRGPG